MLKEEYMVQKNQGNMVRDETIQSRQEPGYGGACKMKYSRIRMCSELCGQRKEK